MNFIPATVREANGGVRVGQAHFSVATSRPVDPQRLRPGAGCFVGVRPEDVHLAATGGIRGTVYAVEPLGGETIVDITVDGDRIFKALAPAGVALEIGAPVGVELDVARLHLFDDAGAAVLSAAGDATVFSLHLARG